jgi:hypothetical protein
MPSSDNLRLKNLSAKDRERARSISFSQILDNGRSFLISDLPLPTALANPAVFPPELVLLPLSFSSEKLIPESPKTGYLKK